MEHPCQTADFSGVSHRETLSNPSFAHRCAFAQQDGDQNLLGSTLAQSGLSFPLSTKDLYYLPGNKGSLLFTWEYVVVDSVVANPDHPKETTNEKISFSHFCRVATVPAGGRS